MLQPLWNFQNLSEKVSVFALKRTNLTIARIDNVNLCVCVCVCECVYVGVSVGVCVSITYTYTHTHTHTHTLFKDTKLWFLEISFEFFLYGNQNFPDSCLYVTLCLSNLTAIFVDDKARSRGLVVFKADGSWSRGHWFKPHHHILNGCKR